MAEFSKPENDFDIEASIPEGAAPLESILCTEELHRRPPRPPDYETENRAPTALVSAMVEPNSNILRTFADTIPQATQCDSASLSLLTKDGGKRFYWPAIAGAWGPHAGGGTPRNFGPCGNVLDQNRTLLFRHFEKRYPYLQLVTPAAEECLLVPFYAGGKAVGTIWAIMRLTHQRVIRELRNLIERAIVLSTGSVLRPGLTELKRFPRRESSAVVRTLAEPERDHILEALEQTNWLIRSQNGAAARLGLPRTTLIHRMRKLGIEAAVAATAMESTGAMRRCAGHLVRINIWLLVDRPFGRRLRGAMKKNEPELIIRRTG